MDFKDDGFGVQRGLDDLWGGEPHDGVSAFVGRDIHGGVWTRPAADPGLIPVMEEEVSEERKKEENISGNVLSTSCWHSKKLGVYKPGGEPLPLSSCAASLVSAFPASRLWKTKFCFLNHPVCSILLGQLKLTNSTFI